MKKSSAQERLVRNRVMARAAARAKAAARSNPARRRLPAAIPGWAALKSASHSIDAESGAARIVDLERQLDRAPAHSRQRIAVQKEILNEARLYRKWLDLEQAMAIHDFHGPKAVPLKRPRIVQRKTSGRPGAYSRTSVR